MNINCTIEGCTGHADQVLSDKELDLYWIVCSDHFMQLSKAIDEVRAKVEAMNTQQLEARLKELNEVKTFH